MPSWISKTGIWEPAKEKVATTKIDENGNIQPTIYEGKDRAALEVLEERKLKTLGMSSRQDPEVIMRARQLNMTIDEFMTMYGPLTPEQKAAEDNKSNIVVTHQPEPKKQGVRPRSGGAMEGGFGEIPG